MTRSYDRRHKARPFWHDVTCTNCQAAFEELSYPDWSFHLCSNCLHAIWGVTPHDQPLQHALDADDWWHDFVYQHERAVALGIIDQTGKPLIPAPNTKGD